MDIEKDSLFPTRSFRAARSLKLLLSMLLIVWLSYLGFLFYSYQGQVANHRQALHSQAQQRDSFLVSMQSVLLDNTLNDIDRSLVLLRQTLSNPDSDLDYRVLLTHFEALHPEVSHLLISDQAGQLQPWVPGLRTVGPPVRPNNLPAQHGALNDEPILSRPSLTDRYAGETGLSDTPALVLARPLFNAAGHAVGILAAALHTETLAEKLAHVGPRNGLQAWVASTEGELLFSTPYRPAPAGLSVDFITENSSGTGTITRPQDSSTPIIAFTTLSNWGITVFTEEDLTPLNTQLREFEQQQIIRHSSFGLAGTTLLLVIGLLLIRRAAHAEELQSGQQALAASNARNQAIVQALPDLLITVSADGLIIDYESGAASQLLMPAEDYLGKRLSDIVPPRLANKMLRIIRHSLKTGQVLSFEHPLHVTEQRHHFEARVSRLSATRALLIILDISQRKMAEESLQWQVTHDSLTQLPNRVLFYDRLQQATAEHQRSHRSFALLYMDLDGFKAVNDTLGHQAGDELLQQVATRLRQHVRASDTVARLAGDEFALIARRTNKQDARILADKLEQEISREYFIGEHTILLSTSIGIAVCPSDGNSPDTLVKTADQAMYRCKRGHHQHQRKDGRPR